MCIHASIFYSLFQVNVKVMRDKKFIIQVNIFLIVKICFSEVCELDFYVFLHVCFDIWSSLINSFVWQNSPRVLFINYLCEYAERTKLLAEKGMKN